MWRWGYAQKYLEVCFVLVVRILIAVWAAVRISAAESEHILQEGCPVAVQHYCPRIISDKTMSGQLQLHKKCDSDAALGKGKNILIWKRMWTGNSLFMCLVPCLALPHASASGSCWLLVDTQALAHSLITDFNNDVNIRSNQNVQCFSVTLGSKVLQSLLIMLCGCL